MDKLRLLKFYITAVDKGSFAAAALHLRTSPSTISKAIVRLEKNIGIQLLQRNTRHLKLSEAGAKYVATARAIVEQLEECEKNLQHSNDQPRGVLRIDAPVSYGRLYIRPLLKKFQQQFPEISIDLSYSDKYVDLIEQRIDLCVRSGTVKDSGLIVRQLSPIDFLICASPDYLKNHGCPRTVSEFSNHRWIRFRFQQTGQLMPITLSENGEYSECDPDQSYIVDDGEALAELCADGLGLTQLPHFIARNWLLNKTVVPIFPAYTLPGSGVYVMYPKRDYLPVRVKVFIDFLCAQMEALGETPTRTWASEFPIFNLAV